MGFYGNIQNSNKTAFTFDLIYHSRLTMVNHANDDGVFLGRYVLVDYDETAVLAYYNSADKWFYNDKSLLLPHKILNPKFNIIYEVANEDYPVDQPRFFYYRPKGFYEENSPAQFEPISIKITDGTGDTIDAVSISPYAVSHTLDVREFGRGYDSTVWQKVFDNGKYKYVLVAELNAKVPNFRLIADHPTETPVAPYFDRDSTTMDYYLHLSSSYGNRVKAVKDNNLKDRSDEKMTRYDISYDYTDESNPTWSEKSSEYDADIYYNKAGFNPKLRTYVEGDKSLNTINYDRVSSEKRYGYQDGPIHQEGKTYPDTYEWYFRLPVIGNAICSLWDSIYGYNSKGIRYHNLAQKDSDSPDRLVTYDTETLYGTLNRVRDLMGHEFLPVSVAQSLAESEIVDNQIIYYLSADNGNKPYNPNNEYQVTDIETVGSLAIDTKLKVETVTDEGLQYIAKDVLYYDADENGPIKSYYYFAYSPIFESIKDNIQLTDEGKLPDGEYYFKMGEEYIYANPELYNATDANGVIVSPNYDHYYRRVDRWVLTKLEQEIPEDTIHGLILKLHKLIGTGDVDTRDKNTLMGAMHRIKDIVSNINLRLAPGRMLHTNEKTGVIETTATYFPSAKWDKDEVLDGEGHWVSRFAQVTILPQSTNANQDAPEVNDISEDGKENDGSIILESDNDKEAQGNEAVRRNKHSANNLTLGTRNKWIELHPNTEKDSIEFQHANSSIVDRLYAEQADGGSSKNVNSIREDNEPNLNNNNITITDDDIYKNFTVNKEIEITVTPTSDDSLKYSSENVDTNDNRLTIPYLTADNAGHIVELGTKNFNIPHGFKKVATTIIADTNESTSLDQAGISIAESIADTLNLESQNRWIDIATVNNNTNGDVEDESVKTDKITFGHKLVSLTMQNLNSAQNGDYTVVEAQAVLDSEKTKKRLSNPASVPTVYRYGLPQDKSITILDSSNGHEIANTFNVPYIEVDKAGHIVAAETHTVTLPENFETITIAAASDNLSKEYATEDTKQDAGTTMDEYATANIIKADSLSDNLTFNTGNKWIRLAGTDENATEDIITISHEIHNIRSSTNAEDMDTETNKKDKFTTQVVQWDNAGHIVSHDTKTWTLPNSIHDLEVTGTSSESDNPAGTNGTIIAGTTFDVVKLNASNKWVRLTADPTNNSITFGHLVQGTAGIYNNDEYTFNKTENDTVQTGVFGGSVTLHGYQTDNAGHIIANQTYSLKLPEGSYSESGGDVGSNVLTSLSFTPASGAFVGTKVNIGTLKITGYSTVDMTAQAISANNTLNQALAYLQLEINAETARAENEESTLQANLNTEASTRSEEDGKLQDAIDKEIEDRTNAINTVDGKITTLSENVYTKADVYTKTEVYANTEVYTKTEIDNAIYTKAQVDQAIKDAISAFARDNGLTAPSTT